MQQLTEKQKQFVIQNHEIMTKVMIVKRLCITPEALQQFADISDIVLIDRTRMPAQILTDSQKQYIQDNSSKKSIFQISTKIKSTFYNVKKYMDKNKLPYFDREYASGAKKNIDSKKSGKSITDKIFPKAEQVPVYIPDEKKTVIVTKYRTGENERPPAQYSNPDWSKMYLDRRI